MPLAEHRRADGKRLADGGLGRLSTEVDDGHDVHDGYASDHGPTLSNPGVSRKPTAAEATPWDVSAAAGEGALLDRSKKWPSVLVRASVQTIHRPSCLPQPLGARRPAGNLRWSWHPPTQDVFSSIDAAAGARSSYPVRFLGAVGRERLDQLVDDGDFRVPLGAAHADLQRYLTEDRGMPGVRGLGEVALEVGVRGAEARAEVAVVDQLVEPFAAHGTGKRTGSPLTWRQQLGVDRGEHVLGGWMPGPAQVAGQGRQRPQGLGEDWTDGESSERSHGPAR